MLDAHPIRDLVAKRRFRVSEFGAGPECVAAHDPVALMKFEDSRTDGGDHPGGFSARDERGFGPELIFPGEHQHIDVLHTPCADSHLNLTRTGRRWIGQIP